MREEDVYYFEGVVTNPEIDSQGSEVLDFKRLFGSGKNAVSHEGKGIPRYSITYRRKLAMRDAQGREHICSFTSRNLEFKEGEKIALVCSKDSDYVLRVINLSTGRIWKEIFGFPVVPVTGSFVQVYIWYAMIKAALSSILPSLPVVNIIFSIFVSSIFFSKRVSPPSAAKYLLAGAIGMFLISYVIYFSGHRYFYSDIDTGALPKSSAVHFVTMPLALVSGENFSMYADIEKNRELVSFYNSKTFHNTTDFKFVELSMWFWVALVTFAGYLFLAAHTAYMVRFDLLSQIKLDDLSEKYLSKKEAGSFFFVNLK